MSRAAQEQQEQHPRRRHLELPYASTCVQARMPREIVRSGILRLPERGVDIRFPHRRTASSPLEIDDYRSIWSDHSPTTSTLLLLVGCAVPSIACCDVMFFCGRRLVRVHYSSKKPRGSDPRVRMASQSTASKYVAHALCPSTSIYCRTTLCVCGREITGQCRRQAAPTGDARSVVL